MKIAEINEATEAKLVYRGIAVPLEIPVASRNDDGRYASQQWKPLLYNEIISVLDNLKNNFTKTYMHSGLHVTDNIGYALLYASNEMDSQNSDLTNMDNIEQNQRAAMFDSQIQNIGAIFVFDAKNVKLSDDPTGPKDTRDSGPARGLFSGKVRSFIIPKEYFHVLDLIDVLIYPAIAYHGGTARSYYSLMKSGTAAIANRIIKLPYWPDVIYKNADAGSFKYGETEEDEHEEIDD